MPRPCFRNPTPLLLLALCLGPWLAGCGDDDAPRDAGPGRDAPASDAPATDAPATDAPGVDAPGTDGGSPEDAGRPMPLAGCAERTAEIVAATGPTIEVAPAGDGQVMVEGGTRSLRQVVQNAEEGTTILLADGTYTLADAAGGGFTGLYITTPNLTLRSASGDPSAVIIDSAYREHGSGSGSITVAAPGVVLSGFTVRRSVHHLIHFWADGDDALVHDVHLVDGGQQFLKASPGAAATVDRVEVSCSEFRMTDEGRDNVWGYGPSDGNTTCYTGGIDTHGSRDWHVHDNLFEGIYCDADGVARPAHGRAASERGGMTYTGGLSEHAIHMWESAADSEGGHVIERNRIVDCARGIGLGLRDQVFGGRIVNNTVSSRFAGSREHDVGIIVERGQNVLVAHNTVVFTHADAYPNAIEIRWDVTSNVEVRNNLTAGIVRSRNGATPTLGTNLEGVDPALFVDAPAGDLHLRACEPGAIVDAGETVPGVTHDLDGDARDASPDLGADEC